MADVQVVRAIVLSAEEDGVMVRAVEIADTLDDLQAIVGGNIECVYIDRHSEDRAHFYINEEGKLLGLPLNVVATGMWYQHGYVQPFTDFLAGDVLVLGDGEDGAEGDCPAWAYEYLGLRCDHA